MIENFKPHLSAKVDFKKLDFEKTHYLGSIKLDGIRTLNLGTGEVLSRTLKPIPNRHVQEILSRPEFALMDGEIIVGPPNAVDVYRNTNSGVMSRDGEPDFKFYVFDDMTDLSLGYSLREQNLIERVLSLPADLQKYVERVPTTILESMDALLAYEVRTIEQGYEGAILRHPDRPYKFGRSTNSYADQGLMKLKRLESSEAMIVGLECEYENANEATTDNLGHTKRSSHKENKIPKDTLGRLYVKDVHTDVEFSIGVFRGFTKADLKQLWDNQDNLLGRIVRYDYFPVGMKGKVPRHPVGVGFRDPIDFSVGE